MGLCPNLMTRNLGEASKSLIWTPKTWGHRSSRTTRSNVKTALPWCVTTYLLSILHWFFHDLMHESCCIYKKQRRNVHKHRIKMSTHARKQTSYTHKWVRKICSLKWERKHKNSIQKNTRDNLFLRCILSFTIIY